MFHCDNYQGALITFTSLKILTQEEVGVVKILGLFRVLEFSFCPANAPQFDHFHGRGGAGLGSNGILRGGAGRGSNRFFRRGAGRGTPFAPRGGASIPGTLYKIERFLAGT